MPPVARTTTARSNPTSGFNTVIGVDMLIEGKVTCDESARVDGQVVGPVNVAQRLVTSAGSLITGNINGDVVEIGGSVVGDIEGREVRISRTAIVRGNISCEKLETESGAVIEGKIIMDQSGVANPFASPSPSSDLLPAPEPKKAKKAE